ncbi:hypothetical protein CDL15_Pgr004833 [Punica granatum]|uniref:AT-rich interactive domain-containing protein 3-like n=1 Tax=Punica granatum TaxID=22663 RepID=A0A218W827_PUNGR|nr:hypothetical protein CDL15_Pgr004833 [Punica granatum]
MGDAKENKEVGQDLPPAEVPVEALEPSEVRVEALEEESSQAGTKEEHPNSVQNGDTPVAGMAHDDKESENVSCTVEPPAQQSADLAPSENEKASAKNESEHVESDPTLDSKGVSNALPEQKTNGVDDSNLSSAEPVAGEALVDAKMEDSGKTESKTGADVDGVAPVNDDTSITPNVATGDAKAESAGGEQMKINAQEVETPVPKDKGNVSLKDIFLLDENDEGSESGTEEEQAAFMKELENFFKEKNMEFKPPKFYGEGLNCLKLWRSVVRLGGYDKVTSCKLWRQVGEAFRPPKTCTTVSWTFRGFYEKALLDYEKDKIHGGELGPVASPVEPTGADNPVSGSNRARRDAAARAMQGWYSQRLLTNGEVSDPIIKDKSAKSLQKQKQQLKSSGSLKRKKSPYMENPVKSARIDVGPPADWVKINVQKTKDCFEVYALVPGLLREEVRVQSDPAGRLVISGEPEHPDNPWGVTPFKKVVNLPSRIDPHQTSAVVTLHGQLFVRVPFEQSE